MVTVKGFGFFLCGTISPRNESSKMRSRVSTAGEQISAEQPLSLAKHSPNARVSGLGFRIWGSGLRV